MNNNKNGSLLNKSIIMKLKDQKKKQYYQNYKIKKEQN